MSDQKPRGVSPEDIARRALAAPARYQVTLLGASGSPIGHATIAACCEHSATADVKADFAARGLRVDAVARKVKP
jgi:hypothetical protein